MFPIKTTERVKRWPVVTWLLIAVNIWAFVQTLQLSDPNAFFRQWGLVPARFPLHDPRSLLQTPEVLQTLASCMFLHAGFMHVIGNMLSLFVFGPNVEDRFGRIGFAVIYLACGLAASITQIFFALDPDLPVVGASGAVAGVMGAFFVMYPKARVVSVIPVVVVPVIVRIPAFVYLLFWAGMNLINALKQWRFLDNEASGVAWWAHLGGFAIGAAYALVLSKRKPHEANAGET